MNRVPASGDRQWAGVQIEHAERVERVAIRSHDWLLVDGRGLAEVSELAESTCHLDVGGKADVGLRAVVVVHRDRERLPRHAMTLLVTDDRPGIRSAQQHPSQAARPISS
jgi:hypothetical protein